jgi:hypothetical protein
MFRISCQPGLQVSGFCQVPGKKAERFSTAVFPDPAIRRVPVGWQTRRGITTIAGKKASPGTEVQESGNPCDPLGSATAEPAAGKSGYLFQVDFFLENYSEKKEFG